MRRLARVLARYDRSGNCAAIYPANSTILKDVRARELNYPEDERFTWSKRTLVVYLNRLSLAGIATASGLSHYHGTKRRALHPDKLLSVPRESCTPIKNESCTSGRRESCTRSKSLKSKKHQESRKDHQTAATPDDFPLASQPKPKPSIEDRLSEDYGIDRDLVLDELADIRAKAGIAGTHIQSEKYLITSFENRLGIVQEKQKRRTDYDIERQRAVASIRESQSRETTAIPPTPEQPEPRPIPVASDTPPLTRTECLEEIRKAKRRLGL